MRDYRFSPYYETRLLNEVEPAFFVYANSEWIRSAPADFWSRFRFLNPRASAQYGPNMWQKTRTLVTLFNRMTDENVDVQRLLRRDEPSLA